MGPETEVQNLRPVMPESQSGLEGVSKWFKEQLKRFGEMTVEPAPLTDGAQWKAEFTSNGEIDNVDGKQFNIPGQKVTKYKQDGTIEFEWTQPGLIQKEGEVTIPRPDGQETTIRISGFVGIITDPDGNTLLSLAQEPFANTPKKILIRTPFQTSAAKLQGIIDGKRELDPQLFDLITSIDPEKNPEQIFRMGGGLDIFPLPYADANRISATNLGFTLRVSDPELHSKLENEGKNRWCNPVEVKALAKAGLLNGLTASAILASL